MLRATLIELIFRFFPNPYLFHTTCCRISTSTSSLNLLDWILNQRSFDINVQRPKIRHLKNGVLTNSIVLLRLANAPYAKLIYRGSNPGFRVTVKLATLGMV
jgi:hypothetical protein